MVVLGKLKNFARKTSRENKRIKEKIMKRKLYNMPFINFVNVFSQDFIMVSTESTDNDGTYKPEWEGAV